jgi:polyferredoxin
MTWSRFIGSSGLRLLKGFLVFAGLSLLFSKAWCGYICPLGTIQDWITKIRKHLHIRFSIYGETTFKGLKKIKYILLFLLIIIPLGASNSLLWLPRFSHDVFPPFCKICPGRIVLPLFTGDTSQIYIDFSTKTALVMTALGMVVAGVFFTGSFVKKRFFCLFCPMSALLYIFSKAPVLRLNKEGAKCTKCGNCYRVCDVGIKEIADDITNRNVVKDDCMMCFKCVEACPEEGCLKVSFLNIPIFISTETGFFKRYGPTGVTSQ